MTAESHEITERSRKNESTILQGLQSAGQVHVAAAMGVSESTVSRMKSEGEIRRIGTLLAACGLKAVPKDYRCAKPEVIDAYLTIARAALNQANPHELTWDD